MRKVLITTVPFGEKNKLPLELLDGAQVEYVINPLGRKLNENELAEMIEDVDVLIAGTEPIIKVNLKQSWNTLIKTI
jgi:D-3-phosphoglycerate dehydrogenase / 2-oxoglutarate reductase